MLSLLVLTAVTAAPIPLAWTPPADPDPKGILREAKEDADNGRYAVALAKHQWLRENAHKYAPGGSAVPPSFTLSAWVALGERYPPARDALLELRRQAVEAVGKAT